MLLLRVSLSGVEMQQRKISGHSGSIIMVSVHCSKRQTPILKYCNYPFNFFPLFVDNGFLLTSLLVLDSGLLKLSHFYYSINFRNIGRYFATLSNQEAAWWSILLWDIFFYSSWQGKYYGLSTVSSLATSLFAGGFWSAEFKFRNEKVECLKGLSFLVYFIYLALNCLWSCLCLCLFTQKLLDWSPWNWKNATCVREEPIPFWCRSESGGGCGFFFFTFFNVGISFAFSLISQK